MVHIERIGTFYHLKNNEQHESVRVHLQGAAPPAMYGESMKSVHAHSVRGSNVSEVFEAGLRPIRTPNRKVPGPEDAFICSDLIMRPFTCKVTSTEVTVRSIVRPNLSPSDIIWGTQPLVPDLCSA